MAELPSFPSYIQSYYDDHVTFRTIRPIWKTSPKYNSIERFDFVSGGDRPLPDINLKWPQESRINSLENVGHRPGGRRVTIKDDPLVVEGKAKVDCLADKKTRAELDMQLEKISSVKLPIVFEPYYGGTANVTSGQRVHFNLDAVDDDVKNSHLRDSYSHIPSKIGSLDNSHYRVRPKKMRLIFNDKLSWNAAAKVNSLENVRYVPERREIKIFNKLPTWRMEGKIGTTESGYKPPVSSVMIPRFCLNWEAEAKVGSLDNIRHVAGGGGFKIVHFNVHAKAKSKVHTLAHKKKRRKKFKCDFPFLMA